MRFRSAFCIFSRRSTGLTGGGVALRARTRAQERLAKKKQALESTREAARAYLEEDVLDIETLLAAFDRQRSGGPLDSPPRPS